MKENIIPKCRKKVWAYQSRNICSSRSFESRQLVSRGVRQMTYHLYHVVGVTLAYFPTPLKCQLQVLDHVWRNTEIHFSQLTILIQCLNKSAWVGLGLSLSKKSKNNMTCKKLIQIRFVYGNEDLISHSRHTTGFFEIVLFNIFCAIIFRLNSYILLLGKTAAY